MRSTVIHQNILSKILPVFLLFGLILPSFIPVVARAKNNSSVLDTKIEIPDVVIGTKIIPDLSRVDWDSVSTLQAISNVPDDIKNLVLQYQSNVASIDGNTTLVSSEKVGEKLHVKQALQHLISKNLIAKGELPENYFKLNAGGLIESADHIININKNSAKKFDLSSGESVNGEFDASKLKITHSTISKNNTANTEKENLTNITTPTSTGLAYLLAHQNNDGSWGNTAKSFVTTVAVLDVLKSLNETGTPYQNGVAWLDSYITENNDNLAEQIKTISISSGESTNIMALIAGLDEVTGGFVFDRGYNPDTMTTAKALEALTSSSYIDGGDNPNLTIGMAIYYLTQSQRPDGLWSTFTGGSGSISLTVEVIKALLPYKNQVLSGLFSGDIVIKDYINKAIFTLKNLQSTNGIWGNSLLNTALAFYGMMNAGVSPTYQNLAISYIQSAQAADGSFANGDLYATAKALKALSVVPIVGAMGDPTIDDIVPLSTLRTGDSATIKILVTNHGNAVINTGILHIVTDGYIFGTIDLNAIGIVINPNSTEQININLPNTRGFVGDVKFNMFIEGVGGVTYSNSRRDKTLTFAPDSTGLPGLPTYFISQKYTISNTPTLNMRWEQKNDPNRLNYLIMWRTVGSSAWSYYPIDNTWNGAFLLPFVEDQPYETTVGAVALDGSRYTYYNNLVTVIMSADETKYTNYNISGSVNANGQPILNKTLFGYSVYGSSDQNGNYIIGGIPYGSSAFHVDNFLYEPYWTRFVNSGNNIQNLKVFTLPRIDTQNPTVTNLTPYAYPNYKLPGKSSVSLSYFVNDDIGNGFDGFVASAKFEYYDPHDSIWHFIGTQEGEIHGSWAYTWNVPGNLLGTGYQLRVTVRDFSGKESTPSVYGPFEITAGNNAPTFSFTPPGAGSGLEADLNYTIKWTAHDDEDNATINFVYDVDQDPNNGNNIAIVTRHTNDFLNQYEWDTSLVPNGVYYVRALVNDTFHPDVVVTSPPITILHVAPIASTNLFTIGQTNPINVPVANLKFSAIYHDPNITDTATHYRIQVANSSTFITSSLIWDGEKNQFATPIQEGSRTSDISYTGPGLLAGTTYYWRIKLWDNSNNEGAWSTSVATFSTAGAVSGQACVVPVSGDWIITSSCTLTGIAKPPQSVIVNAGVVLTLSPGSKLLIDLKHYKILVKHTGGVLIKNTATLRQVRLSD